MHPWHDCYVDDTIVESVFPVVIEVPKGSKNKYELDKGTGLLRLDRVLHSAVYYPADYGFIETSAKQDGRNMTMVLAPHRGAKTRAKAAHDADAPTAQRVSAQPSEPQTDPSQN